MVFCFHGSRYSAGLLDTKLRCRLTMHCTEIILDVVYLECGESCPNKLSSIRPIPLTKNVLTSENVIRYNVVKYIVLFMLHYNISQNNCVVSSVERLASVYFPKVRVYASVTKDTVLLYMMLITTFNWVSSNLLTYL